MAMKLTLWKTVLAFSTLTAAADDWPQWIGPKRDGVWRETGIVEKIPTTGLPVQWKVPVNAGYAGPAVVGDLIYLHDDKAAAPAPRKPGERALPEVAGNQRALCLDATTRRA
jgi:hypothetical protein